MCGIFACVYRSTNANTCKLSNEIEEEWLKCREAISARGPDGLTEKLQHLIGEWHAHFAASVLWTQGSEPVMQPLIDSHENILLWNGDIFSESSFSHDDRCDTLRILESFGSSQNILESLKSIQGPYSFIYFQKLTGLLYFGRDPIGRHSLLMKLNADKTSLTLCSVASKDMLEIFEVPAIGVFVCDMNSQQMNLTCYPWKEPNLRFTDIVEDLETKMNMDIDIKETITPVLSSDSSLHLDPEPRDIEYLKDLNYSLSINEVMGELLANNDVLKRVETITKLLKDSVEVRVKKKPNYCQNCIKKYLTDNKIHCKHAKVGILFSGGLDSAIIAVLAHQFIPKNEEIDLLNVAFEKSTNLDVLHGGNERIINFDVPDRKTGKQAFAELERICLNRHWNFVEVNVTQEELRKYRSSHIGNLVYPLRTILDESLGCAVWFASRAKGVLSGTEEIYESPCRILLLGMGADELFGGYMRHRTTLRHKGWGTLTQELNIELDRISERNLGRDDRIVSDHGRQSRLPYLDENLVKYVQSLKPWERCYPTDQMPVGLGDKLLLRLVARKMGLQGTANFPKRAFQFGSRIANGRENAKDISERL